MESISSEHELNVLILVEWYYPVGGIEMFVANLVSSLDKRIDVTLAVCYIGRKSELPQLPSNVSVVDVTGNTFQKVQELTRTLRPDVIHTNHDTIIGIAALRTAKELHIPIMFSNHVLPIWPGFFNKFANVARWVTQVRFNNSCTLSSGPSMIVGMLLERHGLHTPYLPISCGVDTERFSPHDRNAAREKLGLDSTPIVLFVGRIAKEKRIPLIIKAQQALRNEQPFKLALIGPEPIRGGDGRAVRKLIAEYGLQQSVVRTGYIPSASETMLDWYAAADLFCIASNFETQSIVTLEAMASGLPVVASDAGALPESVLDGDNGLLFQSGNHADLAEKLRTILSDGKLRNAMGKRGREHALEHELNLTAQRFESIYYDLSSQNLPRIDSR